MTSLEKAQEIARVHLAPLAPRYGHGAVIEDIRAALEEASDRSKLEHLTRTLHSICITLGLETWEDAPSGDSDAILGAVERALNARTLEAFERGLRAGRASVGADPVGLPEDVAGNYLGAYLEAQEEWSAKTFGHSTQTLGIVQHIRKELEEIIAKPHDLSEWVDVMILAMDGYWRHGGKPSTIMAALLEKQAKNFARKWPAPGPPDQATEHIRDGQPLQVGTPELRSLVSSKIIKFQTDPIPELPGDMLTRDKIREAVMVGVRRDRKLKYGVVDSITDAVCELLSSKGARVLQTGAPHA